MSHVPTLRGFVVQPTYRIEAGRPVIHLYGRLEDGRTFLVRDRRQTPFFYVEAGDADRARGLGARPLAPTPRVTLDGRPVVRVEVGVPREAALLRDRLLAAGIRCHEADVRFAMRYLIDRSIRGSLGIRGEARAGAGVGAVFEDPETTPCDWTPRLSVLAIDIETDPRAERLLSIALHGCGVSEVLLLTPAGWSCPETARGCGSEKELLERFAARLVELDPDVVTGWNVIDFDLSVLARLSRTAGVRLELGRGPGVVRLPERRGRHGGAVDVPGRVVLDGIELLRGAFVKQADYSLDAVAREVLGEGKPLAGPDRAGEILRRFKHDRAALVEYNRGDARLALAILEKLQLVELSVARSRLTGLPLDRVASSIAAFDFLYLSALGPHGVVAPSVGASGQRDEAMAGGHVLEPVPGLHAGVAVLDFKSLYPSLIRTFQIDPLNLLAAGAQAPADEGEPIVAPNGAAFRRRTGILTELLDRLMPERDAARREGDAVKSHAIKILMNSFYGVLGTSACRFYDPRLANAITGLGRDVLLWCRERIEAGGLRVLYGDTDSLFVATGLAEAAAARAFGQSLAARLTAELAEHLARRWQVTSRLELQFDRLYLRLLLPAVRHGTTGARKRYAGLVAEADGPGRLVFTGMESVRGDWTELAKLVQHELYARLFGGRPVDDYLRQVVADVRAGRLDERLVYRKALRKDPAAYTATTPPHVAAARKLGRRRRGRIAYVVTQAGPEPAAERRSAIDYEHYVEKQVRPVAEPVLAVLGLDFDDLAGGRRQMSLFE